MIWRAVEFLKYLLKSFHLHGIHSPFVFELNEKVFQEKSSFYAFQDIESIRAKLLLTDQKVKVKDLGAGSRKDNGSHRRIKDIAQYALKPAKKAQLMFRLVNHFKPDTILELGTSLGVTTAYLAKACPKAKIISIEGAPEIAKIAQLNLEKLQISNVTQRIDSFEDALQEELSELEKVDFVFFDGNHQKEPTLDYFKQCLDYSDENSVFVFDDIHWSKGMTEAWEEIKKHPKTTISIDLFDLGIVFFKQDQAQQNFTVYH